MTAELVFLMVLSHFLGDYLIQTNWMAVEKTKRWLPAVAHGVTYTIPFALFVTRSPLALLVIGGTHILIDHWRLAKYVVWLKNQLVPARMRFRPTDTGYPADMPPWMAVWLMIIADNLIHVMINYGAVKWL